MAVTRKQKKELDAVRRRQAERLWRAAGKLRRIIYEDVKQAAKAAGLAHGYWVLTPPVEPVEGKDLTARCAGWLAEMWSRRFEGWR